MALMLSAFTVSAEMMDRPKGIRVGQRMTLRPYVGLSYTFDSNVAARRNSESGGAWVVNPGVNFDFLGDNWSINGGGYYAQYVDTETGERRDTVYTLGGTIDSTLLAPAKSLVKPGIAYPTTATNYFDVSDFTINQKTDDTVGNYEEVITFSFIDMADREDTVERNRVRCPDHRRTEEGRVDSNI